MSDTPCRATFEATYFAGLSLTSERRNFRNGVYTHGFVNSAWSNWRDGWAACEAHAAAELDALKAQLSAAVAERNAMAVQRTPEILTEVEAVIACLDDDLAMLRDDGYAEEIADNMSAASAKTSQLAKSIAATRERSGYDSPLTATIYTAPKAPTSCPTCNKTGNHIEMVNTGQWVCSHVACALRKNLTAKEAR